MCRKYIIFIILQLILISTCSDGKESYFRNRIFNYYSEKMVKNHSSPFPYFLAGFSYDEIQQIIGRPPDKSGDISIKNLNRLPGILIPSIKFSLKENIEYEQFFDHQKEFLNNYETIEVTPYNRQTHYWLLNCNNNEKLLLSLSFLEIDNKYFVYFGSIMPYFYDEITIPEDYDDSDFFKKE